MRNEYLLSDSEWALKHIIDRIEENLEQEKAGGPQTAVYLLYMSI